MSQQLRVHSSIITSRYSVEAQLGAAGGARGETAERRRRRCRWVLREVGTQAGGEGRDAGLYRARVWLDAPCQPRGGGVEDTAAGS